MSADNCIAIGRFPNSKSPNGFEYRIIHAQAIENCNDSSEFPNELTDHYRAAYYGDAKQIFDPREAFRQAHALYNEIEWTEYGLLVYHYDRPLLNKTVEECNQWLDEWWQNNKGVINVSSN